MGWIIAFAILFLLGMIPLGIQIKYDESGFFAKVIAGFLRFTIFPFPKKKKEKTPKEKPKNTEAKKASNAPPADVSESPASSGGSIRDFFPFVTLALDLLGSFRRAIHTDHLYVKMILAADDPCDLAVNYGRAWAAMGNLVAALEKSFTIKDRNIEVECDFTANEILVNAQVDITVSLGRLLTLGIIYGFRGVREFIRFNKKRKGGASA